MTGVDDAAAELYALAPEEFVGTRTALVKQARQAGDKALAGEIGALRKPTRTAWLVNALARDDPGDLGELLDLGDRLRSAQAGRDGAALRELSARRRQQIDALVRRATAIGRKAGHPPAEATVNEVAQTLQAALGDPDVAAQVRAGRLAGAVVYGGFGGPSPQVDAGGDDLAAMLAASMPTTKPSAPTDDAAERERLAALQQARDDARATLADAQADADRATEEADARAAEVERLSTELSAAEEAERAAAGAARTAREAVRTRRAAADEAEAALRSAT